VAAGGTRYNECCADAGALLRAGLLDWESRPLIAGFMSGMAGT